MNSSNMPNNICSSRKIFKNSTIKLIKEEVIRIINCIKFADEEVGTMEKVKLTFDSSARKDILSFFNKEVDTEGKIVESDTKEEVVSPDGEVYENEFAGIKKGSEIFLKNDIISLMRLAEKSKR